MLRGGSVVFSALLSIIFLGRKLDMHHYAGLVISCIGLGIIISQTSYRKKFKGMLILVGVCLTLLSLLLDGIYFVAEEIIFK